MYQEPFTACTTMLMDEVYIFQMTYKLMLWDVSRNPSQFRVLLFDGVYIANDIQVNVIEFVKKLFPV